MEMLRRGYDFHLHYANFGIRKLLIRFPHGLPEPQSHEPYLVKRSLEFLNDKEGSGCCLSIEPAYEAGDLAELWDINSLFERLIPLRAEILEGDLRPLYLAHLAVALDYNHDPKETCEAPVPAALGSLSDAQSALAELYGLSDALIAAAACESPSVSIGGQSNPDYEEWVRNQSESNKNTWLTAMLTDPAPTVRAKVLAKYRSDVTLPTWPTACPNRLLSQLQSAATEIAQNAQQKAVAKANRQRASRLKKMAADPKATLQETERLATQRTTAAYRQIGELLVELREALAENDQSDLAEKQAQKLKANNPTLTRLSSELRRHGFIPK